MNLVAAADSRAPMQAVSSAGAGVFDITMVPAVTAEEGMAIARLAVAR